jgi:15-cis-phytoene synthase
MAFRFPFLSRVQRQALVVLYALQQELLEVVQDCTEANLALTTLNWWQQQISLLYVDKAMPEHPLMQALQSFIAVYALPQSELMALVNAHYTELTLARFQDMNQLRQYACQTGMVQGRLSSRVLGFTEQQTLVFAEKVGELCQTVKLFSQIGADARLGRLYIPVAMLQEFNVPASVVLNGHGSAEFMALLNTWLAELKGQFKSVVTLLPRVDKYRQRASLAILAIAAALLREIEQDGLVNILQYQLIVPRPRQQRLFWKTWLCGFRPV